ncbi:glycoside hydrolase family 16 protein [Lepidopterella palustris CBS 459.81]|uniref:Glycoside hydrolase family 16 protein n=1 Tax=Lepidopterella palustris CBS 459.81 TaxID=1314670 RepID=A0A8E2E308_9PEZI|nr:glycoside hydrolase family 16 protein [Lepidopterella palustris CBS 459.81]
MPLAKKRILAPVSRSQKTLNLRPWPLQGTLHQTPPRAPMAQTQPCRWRHLRHGMDKDSISVWFVPHSGTIHADLQNSTLLFPPDRGTPMAKFGGSRCDFPTSFKDLKILIDTSFSGAWAGDSEVWESNGGTKLTGAAQCEDYVATNSFHSRGLLGNRGTSPQQRPSGIICISGERLITGDGTTTGDCSADGVRYTTPFILAWAVRFDSLFCFLCIS